MSHLIELRTRLLRSIIAVLALFIGLSPFSDQIYSWLAVPLVAQLPKGSSMIAIDVAAPFIVPFKLTLLVAVVIAIPFLLYQIWAFVAPGLYRHEKRMAVPLLVSSTLLFYTGMAFAYFIVFPMMFHFFAKTTPADVKMMTDIGAYLGFVSNMFLAFGAAFEVPVAIVLLTAMGVVTPEKLAGARPYIIVAAFVIGMLLTPPDVMSQVSLAIPLLLLFEVGLLVSRLVVRRKAAREAAGADEYEADEDETTAYPAPMDAEAMDRALDEAEADERTHQQAGKDHAGDESKDASGAPDDERRP
ncbi:twin-arginine translocase subunit TatC [Acidihalobacter prosperus]|nr:twin-arginine translocase subunit TatC [Acidihalobacter prosperus]